MMIDPVKQLALYTRDLLEYDEQLIRAGRENFEDLDLTLNYIAIDSLLSIDVYYSNSFDGVAESMNYNSRLSGDFTVNFYGEMALNNLQKWSGLRGSQQGVELQEKFHISVYRPTSVNDLKILTNSSYHNRYELAIKIQYNSSIDVDTRRIDTAQLDFIKNN